METFGSDAAPPDITSVCRVRDCDIFIGIYARRYETVDPVSEKSIMEMELDEAERAYSGGIIRDLLLYTLDGRAPWPLGRGKRVLTPNGNSRGSGSVSRPTRLRTL
jgi:hypothetical protein